MRYQGSEMGLAGRCAIVTGAGQGIGRETAFALAEAGARVAVADIQVDAARNVANEIGKSDGTALAVEVDVADRLSVERMVESTRSELGPVDILIANAGIQRRNFVHELSTENFQDHLSVNLLGVFHTCSALLPEFYERGRGVIVMTASDSGMRGYAYNAAYCASKFGVLGFMEALADEAKSHGIRVNAVCPAGVRTSMAASVTQANGLPYDTTHWMDPREVADVILFLAGEGSRAIHGQAIPVYGGTGYQMGPAQ